VLLLRATLYKGVEGSRLGVTDGADEGSRLVFNDGTTDGLDDATLLGTVDGGVLGFLEGIELGN